MKNLIRASMFAVFCLMSSASWANPSTGKIDHIDIADSGNYPFRIYIVGTSVVCTGGTDFAYLDTSNANYQAYVGALLSAYLSGKTVAVYSSLVSGQCLISYVSITG